MSEQRKPGQRPTFWQVVLSILAAAFGVQSQQARIRDFTYGNPAAYIIGGIIFTVLFVLILVAIVRLALRAAGG
ncbi:MAG: DUF2970 domain-containing protein [Xanthomonadaceae bacterium]|nr:DUF2970 domain-containing protein [Xanthomonadaceae bacterium]